MVVLQESNPVVLPPVNQKLDLHQQEFINVFGEKYEILFVMVLHVVYNIAVFNILMNLKLCIRNET